LYPSGLLLLVTCNGIGEVEWFFPKKTLKPPP
jgi:hypothetical protein